MREHGAHARLGAVRDRIAVGVMRAGAGHAMSRARVTRERRNAGVLRYAAGDAGSADADLTQRTDTVTVLIARAERIFGYAARLRRIAAMPRRGVAGFARCAEARGGTARDAGRGRQAANDVGRIAGVIAGADRAEEAAAVALTRRGLAARAADTARRMSDAAHHATSIGAADRLRGRAVRARRAREGADARDALAAASEDDDEEEGAAGAQSCRAGAHAARARVAQGSAGCSSARANSRAARWQSPSSARNKLPST